MASNNQSYYQYEPLVTPKEWHGDEKRFSIRLTQLFDELYRNYGQLQAKVKALEKGGAENALTFGTVYPVGSLYLSVVETSPADLFGGTWERIKDTFLLAGGDTYIPGSTGGEAEHQLTVDEMPSHSHIERVAVQGVGYMHWTGGTAVNGSETVYRIPTSSLNSLSSTNVLSTETKGDSHPFRLMPPYLSVYAWKRTA